MLHLYYRLSLRIYKIGTETLVCWKQPKWPSADERIKKVVVHLHNGLLYGPNNGGNFTFCNSMDRPGDYYDN